jgi:hypothetical protein
VSAREELWMLATLGAYDVATESDLTNVGELDPATLAMNVMYIDPSLLQDRKVAGCDELTS